MIKDYNRNLKQEINERIRNSYDSKTGVFTISDKDKKMIREICYINDVGIEDS